MPKIPTTQTIALDQLENSLSSGKYRLLKTFHRPSDNLPVERERTETVLAAPFEVTN
jgi:hypothetical protein